jgi:DNA-binding IclR family transcriptional regulator
MRTVSRIADILELVGDARLGMTLTEIADQTDLSSATCHRLLEALGERRFVERDPESRRWHAGSALVGLADAIRPAPGFSTLAEPVLAGLRDRFQESFALCALVDGQVVCVGSVAAERGETVPLGGRMALHTSASAQAILAHVEPDHAAALLAAAPFTPLTPGAVTSLDLLQAELAAVRRVGHARFQEETRRGSVELAVAVAAPPGEAPRSVGTLIPRERERRAHYGGLIERLGAAARRLAELSQAPAMRGPLSVGGEPGVLLPVD